MTVIDSPTCGKIMSFLFIMTKADWLDFFEAINGRSATEEEIAAALAAGEFQDDAPAVEAAPVQEAPAQPIFAGA